MRLDLKTGQIMKKIFLLPLCISCVCGISACSTQPYNQEEVFISDDDASAIDMTTNSGSRCGVDGISCNENALVNYTRTEADYREYGERTRRDHLYTQAAAGNNLTASIRPTVEEDVVVAAPLPAPTYAHAPYQSPKTPTRNDGAFQQTASSNVGVQPQNYDVAPSISKEQLGLNNRIAPNPQSAAATVAEATPVAKQSKYSYEVVCQNNDCTDRTLISCQEEDCGSQMVTTCEGASCVNQPRYTMVCEDGCEDIVNDDDSVITSEFTEESFDIADYIESGVTEDEISFTDIGKNEEIMTDIDINEVKISDNTILTWEAEEGDNLRELLAKWSAMSGWKLLWQTNRNYVLSAGVMFKGKFADVSSALVRAFARARPAPIATYYKGNRVIVVETMENENAY